jgi:4-amino-4-deoxy-L-arabinose transferase-like glycosyltransferase
MSAISSFSNPSFSPDGVVYSRMMLADRGVTAGAARLQVREFYLSTPLGHSARYRPYLLDQRRGMFTTTAKPFASRVVYPFVASLFYPLQHFRSLIAVSAIAYIAAILLMYWMLMPLCTPLAAAAGAMIFAAAPVMRSLAGAALTDMLAICFLVAAFGAMIRYALYGTKADLALVVAADVLLSLTRPLPYVPLGAALGLSVYALAMRTDAALVRRGAFLVLAALAGWAAYAVAAALTQTPSLNSHLTWLYDAAKTHWVYASNRVLSSNDRQSFATWYLHELIFVAKGWFKSLLLEIYPVAMLVVCAVGLRHTRNKPSASILAGGLIACCFGIFANPVEPELRRLIEAPATIAVAGGIAMLLHSWRVTVTSLASKNA